MIKLLELFREVKRLGQGDINDPNIPLDVRKDLYMNHLPKINLKLGKYDLARGDRGEEFTWEEALEKNLLSKRTKENVIEFFINKLGIKPEKVYVTYMLDARNSYHILAHYKDEPLIISVRQTDSPAAGQTTITSKYQRAQLSFLNGEIRRKERDNRGYKDIEGNLSLGSRYGKETDHRSNDNRIPLGKENILKALKINP
jgi:hypothetical protein